MALPAAANLIFLSDLPSTEPGDKVRFLGCVESYDTDTGILTLSHDYHSIQHVANVTIEHVRERLSSSATVDGAWINVMGYVKDHDGASTTVQATMLWEAGPMKIGDYERSLQARLDASKIVTKPIK